MDDPIKALRDAGYVVDEAIPASDDLPETVYVVSHGEPDFLLTYGTEETLAELAGSL